jgi:Tfp pilus assembly protein PilF
MTLLQGGSIMSRTLNLLDRLLERGRHLQSLGRTYDARHIFSRLSGFKQLSAEVAEEMAVRLAEIALAERKYRMARRHLAAAIARQPDNARYHFLMATALDLDEDGDIARAYEHYRRSLDLEPQQARCLSDFGLVAMTLGKPEEGLNALRKAADLAADDPEIVAKLVEGLCEAEQTGEARAVLRAARFRNPRDLRFTKLWHDFQFQQLCESQEAERESRRTYDPGALRMILPFVRPAPGHTGNSTGRKKFRRDGASSPRPPHWHRPSELPDRRHA